MLAKRFPAEPLNFGNFDSFASFCYALKVMNMRTDNYELIKDIKLFNPFPPDYTPTTGEIFDIIARTTGTSWRYDEKTAYWVFNPPPMPLPYAISLAKGWRTENRGFYIFHAPQSAPVGMDIYLLGHYTPEPETNAEIFFNKIRDFWAMRLTQPFAEEFNL